MTSLEQLAARKALLVTRADLERVKLAIAFREIRATIAPPVDPGRAEAVRPMVARALAIGVPILGFTRMGRFLRTASIALAAYRAIRAWRRG